jgi:hypothetical protein
VSLREPWATLQNSHTSSRHNESEQLQFWENYHGREELEVSEMTENLDMVNILEY